MPSVCVDNIDSCPRPGRVITDCAAPIKLSGQTDAFRFRSSRNRRGGELVPAEKKSDGVKEEVWVDATDPLSPEDKFRWNVATGQRRPIVVASADWPGGLDRDSSGRGSSAKKKPTI